MAMPMGSKLSLTPTFPGYLGPYTVGTTDVEIAAEDISFAIRKPRDAPNTIAYRIFYPCEEFGPSDASPRPVRWIPNPQRANLAGLIKYGGIGPKMADFIALLPRIIYSITIPCVRNARPLTPPAQGWPVTFFSHGLAGNRNLYSHLCASLSSYGAIVIALDHRDGSSPIQHVRATSNSPAQTIESISIPYAGTDEDYAARDKQLRIRCWELSLAFTSATMLHSGQKVKNLDESPRLAKSWFGSQGRSDLDNVLPLFGDKMDLRPGKISWAGHSFGAATMIQFCKSVFYSQSQPAVSNDERSAPLFTAEGSSPLAAQITTDSTLVLLDPWMMPLASPYQASLASKRIPALTKSGRGRNVLTLISEGFWKWKGNLDAVVSEMRSTDDRENDGIAYYARGSKHFSQSDFGVLFSWIIERAWRSDFGRSMIEGNVRLIVDMLRRAEIQLAEEASNEAADIVAGAKIAKNSQDAASGPEIQRQVSNPIDALPEHIDNQIWIRVPTR